MAVRLPNSDRAIIEPAKITGYLLSREHPRGRSKARLLERFGIRADQPDVLRAALIAHAMANDIAAAARTTYGTRYEIDGPLPAPDGRSPVVRVVWYAYDGDDVPRLVTVVPRRTRRQ